jgi:hypothetical protein
MKRHNHYVVILILFISMGVFPQTLQVGGGLGTAVPGDDYSGSTIDFFNGEKYGMGNAFNMHAKARVGLPGFSFFGMIDYSTFSGEGEGEPGRGTVENTHKIFSLKVGPEFNFSILVIPFGFYFDAFLSMNTISGTVSFQGLTQVPSGSYDLETSTRFGAGAGGGVLITIFPLVKLDLGVHYNSYNAFGKEYNSGGEGPGRLEVYTSLNDEKDPLYNTDSDHIVGEARTLEAWHYTVTVMFGI